MLWRWQQAPWWVLGIVQGLLFTLIFAAGAAITGHETFTSTLPGALIAGVVFGALMGPASARMRQRLLAGLPAQASPEQQRAGARAARRGPVPSDPVIQQVAVHLVQRRLQEARHGRVRQLLTFGAFTLVYLGLALVWSRWWLLAAALFSLFLVLAWVEPARLQHRLGRLTGQERP